MAENKIERFGKNNMFGRGLLEENFCKIFVKISAVRLNANFYVSFYKSIMEILSCNSNRSTSATAIKQYI